VNQIEKNVIDAEAYTRKGVSELKKANAYQRKSRKKACVLIICLAGMLKELLLLVMTRSVFDAQWSL
jgi:t-SNARE complex subunit (syntaxin)